jgi:hypothetical protein
MDGERKTGRGLENPRTTPTIAAPSEIADTDVEAESGSSHSDFPAMPRWKSRIHVHPEEYGDEHKT